MFKNIKGADIFHWFMVAPLIITILGVVGGAVGIVIYFMFTNWTVGLTILFGIWAVCGWAYYLGENI